MILAVSSCYSSKRRGLVFVMETECFSSEVRKGRFRALNDFSSAERTRRFVGLLTSPRSGSAVAMLVPIATWQHQCNCDTL
jgi:hypothetical protein